MPADNSIDSPARNFLTAVGRGFARLGDAIKRAIQIQRLRSGIRRHQKDRRRILIAIGEKVYALHTIDRVRNAAIDDECAQIDAIITGIEGLKTRIVELKTPEQLPELIIEPEDTGFLTDDGSPSTGEESPAASAAEPHEHVEKSAPQKDDSPAANQPQNAITAPPEDGEKYDDDLDLDDDLSIEIDLA